MIEHRAEGTGSGPDPGPYADLLLSHEWLAPHGGSENVFEALTVALPGCSRLCLWNDAPNRFDSIHETWLARTPLRRSKALALPLMSRAWRSVPLNGFERVVASSHALGHQLSARAVREGIQGFAYVHTPARYLWAPDMDERGQHGYVRAAAVPLRELDRKMVDARVSYAANSQYVQSRIEHAWGLPSEVIYPPVKVRELQSQGDWADCMAWREQDLLAKLPDEFVFGASRLIEYKRLDRSIEVGEALGLPVVIAGGGPYERALRAQAAAATVPVIFVGRVDDPMLYALYQRATLFAFLPIEDFGIMPVEAMAVGTPVLVNNQGGASESAAIIGGGECISIDSGHAEIRAAADKALRCDREVVMERALEFDTHEFVNRIRRWVGGAHA